MTKIAGILFFLWSMGVSLYSPAQEVKSFKRAVLVEEFSFTSLGIVRAVMQVWNVFATNMGMLL